MWLVGTSVLAACERSAREQPTDERQPLTVSVVPATAVDRAERLEAGGVVAASETAVLSSRVQAAVTLVAVRAGDRVRAGDVLIRLDARDMAARLQEAAGATRAAEESLNATKSAQVAAAAEHKLAAAWHGRMAQLREHNAATAHELDEAEARLAAAAARLTAAQSNIAAATAHLASLRAGGDAAAIAESHSVIRAPFDGEVTERFTDPGNLAAPGLPLLRIDAAGRRRVDVQVDEARAAYIDPGARVSVLLDNAPGAPAPIPLEGTVVEVSRAIAADRAFTVKIALPPATMARTGTFARVRFDGARRRALVIPPSALRRHGQLTSVFVVRDGVARIRLVQVDTTDPAAIEIIAGLDAGESVVATPPVDLTDGRKVSIVPVSQPAGTP
jgi:RND family efflux transporter MFP subunit